MDRPLWADCTFDELGDIINGTGSYAQTHDTKFLADSVDSFDKALRNQNNNVDRMLVGNSSCWFVSAYILSPKEFELNYGRFGLMQDPGYDWWKESEIPAATMSKFVEYMTERSGCSPQWVEKSSLSLKMLRQYIDKEK